MSSFVYLNSLCVMLPLGPLAGLATSTTTAIHQCHRDEHDLLPRRGFVTPVELAAGHASPRYWVTVPICQVRHSRAREASALHFLNRDTSRDADAEYLHDGMLLQPAGFLLHRVRDVRRARPRAISRGRVHPPPRGPRRFSPKFQPVTESLIDV